MQHQLTGIVLCGGKSTRMGSDKGLMLSEGKPWAELMAAKLRNADLEVYLSINSNQQLLYDFFPSDKLIIDDTPIPGPVNGLMSVHQHLPESDLLVVACDMVSLQNDTISNLINCYLNHTGYDFYAFHNTQVWEPFCAIYTARGLEIFKKELKETQDHSFQHLLKEGNTFRLAIDHPESFINRNSL